MSKEWLEEIENEIERSNRAAKNGNTIGAEQMVLDLHEIGSFERLVKYSKKQTKRVQELEEENERYQRHLFEARNDVASQSRKLRKAKEQVERVPVLEFYKQDWMIVTEQNKRYREYFNKIIETDERLVDKQYFKDIAEQAIKED